MTRFTAVLNFKKSFKYVNIIERQVLPMPAVVVILAFIGIAVFILLFLDRVTGKLVNPYSRKYRHRLSGANRKKRRPKDRDAS